MPGSQVCDFARSLFYDHGALFKSQLRSDAAINLLCPLLSTTRASLNYTAAERGRVCGAISYKINGIDQLFDCTSGCGIHSLAVNCELIRKNSNQTYIQTNDGQQVLQQHNTIIKYVLIVEKKTVFEKLCELGYSQRNQCILVTGSGVS